MRLAPSSPLSDHPVDSNCAFSPEVLEETCPFVLLHGTGERVFIARLNLVGSWPNLKGIPLVLFDLSQNLILSKRS